MTIGLYPATVPAFVRMLGNVIALIDKAETQLDAMGMTEAALIEARLAPDMLPFAYQVKSCVVHSLGAIEGVRQGTFSPDMTPPGESFAILRARARAAIDALNAIDASEIDGLAGKPMRFVVRAYQVDFTAESFLLGFSLPNFYFHATTAYDILRANGAKIGKVDYLGQLPMKPVGFFRQLIKRG